MYTICPELLIAIHYDLFPLGETVIFVAELLFCLLSNNLFTEVAWSSVGKSIFNRKVMILFGGSLDIAINKSGV